MDEAIIEVRNLTIEDYKSLNVAMRHAYSGKDGQYWREETIQTLINKFPEGQIVVIYDGKVAGCALSITIEYDKFGDNHTYREVTGNFSFATHSPKGDTLYGIEVFVHPEFRGMRLARRLYDA